MNLTPYRANVSRFGTTRFQSRFPTQQYTQTEQELIPYTKQVEEEERKKRGRFQPLDIIFNLLQTGQYITANIAEEITDSVRTGEPLGQALIDVLNAAVQGLTWKKKGTFEETIFGRKATPEQKGFQGWWNEYPEQMDEPLIKWGETGEGQAKGIFRPKKMLGLLADIILDPVTWGLTPLGLIKGTIFKPTKAALAMATQYADDAVKLAVKGLGKESMQTLAQKGAGSLDEIIKLFKGGKLPDDTLLKHLNQVWKQANREALGKGAGELSQAMGGRMGDVIGAHPMGPPTGGLEDLMGRITSEGYTGTQEKSWRFFQKERFKGERPFTWTQRQWDLMKDKFSKTPVGNAFGDAWWSVMNRGVVGKVRRMFGFRNPYESMLNVSRRQIDSMLPSDVVKHRVEASNIFAGTTDDELARLFDAVDIAYKKSGKAFTARKELFADMGAARPEIMEETWRSLLVRTDDVLSNPLAHGIDVAADEAGKLKGMWQKIDTNFKQWHTDELKLVDEGIINNMGEVVNYMYGYNTQHGLSFKGGVGKAVDVTKKKAMSVGEHVPMMGDRLNLFFEDIFQDAAANAELPLKSFMENFVRQNDLADVALDLREIYMYRAITHSKIMRRGEMVRAFRQFGVDMSEIGADVAPRLMQNLPEIGLKPVSDPSFQGMLFDREVAEIIERTKMATADPTGMAALKGMFGAFTSWWKGMVTLTTGFHLRNYFSNNMTGFLKFGPRWFNLKKWAGPTVAGTFYALNPEKWMDQVKKLFPGTTDGFWMRNLNKRIGDFSNKELAEWFRDAGVISLETHGFSAPETVAEMMGKQVSVGKRINPLSRQFGLFKYSRSVGEHLENAARYQCALMDYSDMVGKGLGENVTEMLSKSIGQKVTKNEVFLHKAATEAKKWFIDYGDFTQFEQKIMKSVIPFYSWTRNNLANQISGVLMWPEMYSMIPKAKQAHTWDEGFDYELQPEWQKQLGMYPVGKDETGQYIMFRPDFPYKDLNIIPIRWEPGELFPQWDWREAIDDIMQTAHPLIKWPMEVMPERGWNFFRRQEIKDYEDAPVLFQYLTKFPKTVQFLDGFMRLCGSQNGLRVNVTKGKVEMDGKVERMLENNMPALRSVAMILEFAEEIGDIITDQEVEAWIERVTGKTDYYEQLDEILQIVSTWGGIKFKMLDMEGESSRFYEDVLEKAEKRRTEAKRTANPLAYAQRSQQYWQARDMRRQRLGLY